MGFGLTGYRFSSDLAVSVTTPLPRIPGGRAELTVPAATRSTVNEPRLDGGGWEHQEPSASSACIRG